MMDCIPLTRRRHNTATARSTVTRAPFKRAFAHGDYIHSYRD